MQSHDKDTTIAKTLSGRDLGSFGMETLAYIKPVMIDGQLLHSIHAADGTQLSVLAGRDIAFATVRQHDLEPISVH